MPYLTGAIASPRHKLAAAFPHRVGDYAPPQFARIPAKLSYWKNDEFGICVTSEEAFAKGCDGLWVSDNDCFQWAKNRRYLNGATLTEVMDDMQTTGLISGQKTWEDGGYFSVNWEDTHILCDAIYAGVVKIGVASNQLPQAKTGWTLLTARKDRAIDHCVSLCGYGPLQWCCDKVGAIVPDGVDPLQPAYLLFTWNSIGVISQSALNAICGEAWVRKPTTVGITPVPIIPDPVDPGPAPQPPAPLPDPSPVPVPVVDWKAVFVLLMEFLLKFLDPKQAHYRAQDIVIQMREEQLGESSSDARAAAVVLAEEFNHG